VAWLSQTPEAWLLRVPSVVAAWQPAVVVWQLKPPAPPRGEGTVAWLSVGPSRGVSGSYGSVAPLSNMPLLAPTAPLA